MHNLVCTCFCHVDGQDIMHFGPCCEYTYEKYIKANGYIDFIRLKEITKLSFKRTPPYIEGSEYVVKNKFNYDSTAKKEN